MGDVAVVEHGVEPIKMPAVDDSSVVRAALWIIAVEITDRLAQRVQQAGRDPAVHPEMVGRDTGLAAVHEFPPNDAPGGHFDRSIGRHDARAFAAEFECHGCQVAGRRAHHHASGAGAASEENSVEFFAQQSLRAILGALDHGDVFLIERFRDHRGDHRRGVRSEFRWLEHGGVAARDRPHQRCKQQLQRVVPWPDDQRHAIGLAAQLGARRPCEKRCPAALRSHP